MTIVSAFLIPALQGCAASKFEDPNLAHALSTNERAAGVADHPLFDLTLSNAVMPPLLIQASVAPYAPSSEAGCAGPKHEAGRLNRILSPDLQPEVIDKHGSLLSKKEAGNAFRGVARGFVNGSSPFGALFESSAAQTRTRWRVRMPSLPVWSGAPIWKDWKNSNPLPQHHDSPDAVPVAAAKRV